MAGKQNDFSDLKLCAHPVFVIGSPRSGTTIIPRALGEHPDLWTSHESFFLWDLFGGGNVDRTFNRHTGRTTPSWLKTEKITREEFHASIGLGINALYSSRSGGRTWIDQTPLYTRMTDELALMFPEARFLHVLRDGRSVVHSMIHFRDSLGEKVLESITPGELPPWVSDFRAACEAWHTHVKEALAFEEKYPDRCLTVRMSDVSADPRSGFARMFAFLEVPFHEKSIEYFERTRLNSSFRSSEGSRGTGGDEVWNGWSDEQRKIFAAEAGGAALSTGTMTREVLEPYLPVRPETRAAPPVSSGTGDVPSSLQKGYTFGNDWFSSNIPQFKEYLIRYAGRPVQFMEIGSYEGRSSTWLLDNILTHENSRLICVDPWVQEKLLENLELSGSRHKVTIHQSQSAKALRALRAEQFDFIYIDGSHESIDVLEDAVLAFRLLKTNGIMAFDDYLWADPAGGSVPKPAVDAFLSIYGPKITVLHSNYQVWIQKKGCLTL